MQDHLLLPEERGARSAAAPAEGTSSNKADPLTRADRFMDRASWWVLGLVFLYVLGQIIRAVIS